MAAPKRARRAKPADTRHAWERLGFTYDEAWEVACGLGDRLVAARRGLVRAKGDAYFLRLHGESEAHVLAAAQRMGFHIVPRTCSVCRDYKADDGCHVCAGFIEVTRFSPYPPSAENKEVA